MSKFDAAIQSLHDTIDDYGVIGVPEICDSCRAAIRVLEAAANVDAESWRDFIAWYGTQHNVYPPGYYELYQAITGASILASLTDEEDK